MPAAVVKDGTVTPKFRQGKISPPFLTAKFSPRNSPLAKFPPPLYTHPGDNSKSCMELSKWLVPSCLGRTRANKENNRKWVKMGAVFVSRLAVDHHLLIASPKHRRVQPCHQSEFPSFKSKA